MLGRERDRAFQLPVLNTDKTIKTTTKCRRQADLAFDELKRASCFKNKKVDDKRRLFHKLFCFMKRAAHSHVTIMNPRNKNHKGWSVIRQQVVDAAVEVGMFKEYRRPPGGGKTGRLIPTKKFLKCMDADPWEFDDFRHPLVVVKKRHAGDELGFNKNHPTAVLFSRKLAEINAVNSQFTITARRYDEWKESLEERYMLRPWHYASFTDDFEHHGRIYTASYGHTELRQIERATIQFNGTVSTEKDFKAFHCTLLYHLRGLECKGDPYALWGGATTGDKRALVKILVNCMINAESPQAALSAANNAMNTHTLNGEKKTGKSLEHAQVLYKAYRKSGLRFQDVMPLVLKTHKSIAMDFFKDKGLELMNVDAHMALSIMHRLVKKGIPCLGIHDSFVVPFDNELDLIETMIRVYRKRTGFAPSIK